MIYIAKKKVKSKGESSRGGEIKEYLSSMVKQVKIAA